MPVTMLDSDGNRIIVQDDKVADAISYGFHFETPSEQTKRVYSDVLEDEYGGISGGIAAGALGVVRGATLGLSDVTFRALGADPQALRRYEEANPNITTGASLLGGLAPALVAPESLLSRLPAGALSRVAASGVEAGRAAGGVGGLATALTASGIEGAGQVGGAYLSDLALGKRELSAEGVAAALGGGFAFGAAGGGLALGIEKGSIAARRMFARTAEGGQRAATEAEQAWTTQLQATTEAHDAAVDAATAYRVADAGGVDVTIERLINEQRQARQELDDLLRNIESPDFVQVPTPTAGVPVGEFSQPGIGGIKTPDQLAARPSPSPATAVLRKPNVLPDGTPVEPRQVTSVGMPGDDIRKEQQALYEYQGGKYSDIQEYARTGKLGEGSSFTDINEANAVLDNIDNAISRERINEDIVLYRGVGSGAEAESRGIKGKIELGSVIEDPGYSSTSTNRDVAIKNYTLKPGATMLEIEAPKGTNAARIVDDGSGENELLLPRKSRFSVIDVRNEDIEGRQIRIARVRLLGSEPDEPTLTGLLRGTQERLSAGENLRDIGAQARAEYAADKSVKGQAFRERNAPMAKEEARLNAERAKELEIQQDDALERAASSVDPVERSAAIAEANRIEAQLTTVGRIRSAPHDIDVLAPAITKYERKSAELAEALGQDAPPMAREHAKAFRDAEAAADRKMVDRTTVAVDDSIESAAKPKKSKRKKVEDDIPTDAETPSVPGKLVTLGNIATGIGVAGELGIPGIPKPQDIPVIGPLLSAYIKYRAIRATVGRFTGRVSATGDTKAAALAARVKDKVAIAVDRALGLIAKAAPKARTPLVVGAAVIGKRIFDDDEPDAPTGATRQEQAAVRIREIVTAATRPDLVSAMVRREMRGVMDPDLIAAAEQHLIARFSYLASVVPKPPPDNAYSMRPWTPSAAATHELEQRLRVIHDPSYAINGPVTPITAETFRKVHPHLYELAKQRLISRLGDITKPINYNERIKASTLFQIPIDASFDPMHISIVRAPQQTTPQTPTPTATSFDVSSMYTPENNRVQP